VLGDVTGDEPVLVRMHRASLPRDVFGVSVGGVGSKNLIALKRIEDAGAGVFVYVLPGQIDLARQVNSLNAAEQQGNEPPELREFGLGAQILASLGLAKIRLMTDNPKRIVGLQGFGLTVVEQVGLLT